MAGQFELIGNIDRIGTCIECVFLYRVQCSVLDTFTNQNPIRTI